MSIQFGRELCGDLHTAEQREWLVTNGLGGYACGTVAGLQTRQYHGLLIAALVPPVGRTLLVSRLEETADYAEQRYPLYTNRWADGTIAPHGYRHIEQFRLEDSLPVWRFACGDALLEKRIWMQQGANTTYIHYTLCRASEPLRLSLKALVNYRDHHHRTVGGTWQMKIEPVPQGAQVTAFPGATPFYLLSSTAEVEAQSEWYFGYDLAIEQYRGVGDREDHFHAATFQTLLNPGESITVIVSTESDPQFNGEQALEIHRAKPLELLKRWQGANPSPPTEPVPDWIEALVLAADQFIVDRTLPILPTALEQKHSETLIAHSPGKTVIAGYPWFGDWGRDTMISLPGLTLATGRPEIARPILRTFAYYLDQGMLPNLFPDQGQRPEYNTVDAILWYVEAIRAYHAVTQDDDLLQELFPALTEVIEWHQRGTRYNIHLDSDGLIYAGEPGVQLTWMDAKVGDWVVTPRIGKPIEISALWYNALCSMVQFAQRLGNPHEAYVSLAQQTAQGFQRFWNPAKRYCYDVLDGPNGNDDALRPNQIFAVALPASDLEHATPLLNQEQQQAVVDTCGRRLLTSHGVRSLSPDHPNYQGHYGGNSTQRDGAYHQGTLWGWLLGPFVQAHLKVYQNPAIARSFLEPMADHLKAGCVGSLSEIFDGDAPMQPRGAFAQAWTVAEILRAWLLTNGE